MEKKLHSNFCTSKLALITFLISLTTSPTIHSLGVGDIKLMSSLGYPLLATMQLSNTKELANEEIHINQASLEVYEKLGVDRSALYRTLLFNIDNNKVVSVYSKEPIKEPFLHFVIEFRWPEGNLYREVKLLLDPPARIN